MSLFKCHSCESLIRQNHTLIAQLHDLQDFLAKREEQHSAEMEKLLDRVMALQSPSAFRELQRPKTLLKEQADNFRKLPKDVRVSYPIDATSPYPPTAASPGRLQRKVDETSERAAAKEILEGAKEIT